MVVESILEAVLSKYLDKMFYGITRENIKAQVLKGRFVISNIGLRESLFVATNMPYDLRHSYVEKIQLNINWTSNQRVVTININKIYALLSIKQNFNLNTLDKMFMQMKKSNIKDHIAEIIKNQTSKIEQEKQKKDGGLSGFLKRLLDNIHINIKSIHLRFEDQPQRYSFGLRIQQIQLLNVNKNEQPQFFNREKNEQNYINYRLKIDPLQIYLNANETNFLYKKDYAEITNQMIMMDNYRRMEGPAPSMFEVMNQWSSGNFTNILTISIKSLLKRYIERENSNLPQYECAITFKKIQSVISDQQFHTILSIVNKIAYYQGKLQHYKEDIEINSYKQREGRELVNLMRKPKSKNKQKMQKEVVKKMLRRFLAWGFKEVYLDFIKKKFIFLAMKKQITAQNLFENTKIMKIIRKVPIFRIKQWVQIAIQMRKQNPRRKSKFELNNQKDQKQYKKQLQRIKLSKQKKQLSLITASLQQKQDKQVVLKLMVLIQKLDLKISKNEQFGLRALMQRTQISILKRRSNFKLDFGVQDLIVDIFKLGHGQKYPTFVPILRKNPQTQQINSKDCLLKLQFQKSPIGQPFVFSSTKLNFQSIQITLYPQVLTKFYELFMTQKQNTFVIKNKNVSIKKKKTNVKSQQSYNQLAGTGFQYNKISGFIQSPWIIIPLSQTNDNTKDCWVLRVGDLNIQTPSNQSSMKSDHRLFYERFLIELKSFELKYFTSINFFYIWLEHGESTKTLQSLPGFKNSKYIDVIQPISCFVDLSVMKKHVSGLVKKHRQSIIAEIQIQNVFISLPKLLLDKLKHKVDVFDDSKKANDFMETDPKIIFKQHTIDGLMKVTNQKYNGITFYAVLKGYFIYFFFKDVDNRDNIIFNCDVRQTTIRLTSDHHSFINEGKTNKLNLQLKQKQNHKLWNKFLSQLVSKRDRIYDKTFDNNGKLNSVIVQQQQSSVVKIMQSKKVGFIQELSQSEMSFRQEDVERIAEKQQSYSSFSFAMQNLCILLIDQKQQDFMNCIFNGTKLCYSNLKQKSLTFSIKQWTILQKQKINENPSQIKSRDPFKKPSTKKKVPFLSCKRIIQESTKNFENQSKKIINEDEKNFLKVKVLYNYITGQLNEIHIDVDQLYISWNISIFNKVLKFFFYKSEMADVPTAPSTQKKSLLIKFKMKRFYLYCFHDEELIALLKLHEITIDYSQSNIEEKYIVNCRKFQMDKYVDNNENKRVPMILCYKKLQQIKKKMKSFKSMQFSQNQSVKLEQSIYEEKLTNVQISTEKQQRQGNNPMYLQYTVRKLKTQKFPNVTRLKKKFGHDLLVSEIKCTWKDFIIYFDMEQTMRLINYFINQILGTVASKFKKKEYSLNYISEVLKMKKITVFDIKFNNFTAILTPHSRVDHLFEIFVEHVDFSKNKREDKVQYQPKIVTFQTQRGSAQVFYDTMVFEISNVTPYYKFRFNPAEKLTKRSFDVFVTYSKLGFSRQYEPILKKLDDIDRTVKVAVNIKPGFQLQLQKITFLTLLQIFYQNIKHRDGKAEKFETPHPHPALKIYEINLGSVQISMYEYLVEQILQKHSHQIQQNILNSSSPNNSLIFSKNMKVFEKIKSSNIKLIYKNIGTNSDINLTIDNVSGFGELPVGKNNEALPSSLNLIMNSVDTETFLKLVPFNLDLNVNLDRLNHIIQFTNYDSDYVSNKIMPKRTKDSFMTVNVFPQKCCARVGQLELYGQFFITYTKDFKNPIDNSIIKYLFQERLQKQKVFTNEFLRDQVSDKNIKVNCQNISIYMNKRHVGILKKLFFGRTQYAAKQTLRRHRKQFVIIDGLSAMMNIIQLRKLYETYEKQIRKAKDYKDKIFLLPFQQVYTKPKATQKRQMQVQFERSTLNVMRMLPQKKQKVAPPPFMSYMSIEFIIPKIVYATYLNEQLISIVDLSGRIMQHGIHTSRNKILEVIGLRLQYLQNKLEHSKYIEIENAKDIKININNMNDQLLALLAKQVTNLPKLNKLDHQKASQKRIVHQSLIMKHYSQGHLPVVNQGNSQLRMDEQFVLVFENTTDKSIEISINNFSFQSQQHHKTKHSKPIMLSGGEQKKLNISGVKLLQLLDLSFKQKLALTEIGFKQDGRGPVKILSLQQIMGNSQVELFSACSIKYLATAQGIKFELFQPCCIINTTIKMLYICLLDRKKKKLCRDWIQVKAQTSININNVHSSVQYIVVQYSNSLRLENIEFQSYPQLIQLSQLPTNRHPNRIGPIHLYPSSMLEIVVWQLENKQRLQLVFFNRFRLQNNLPVSIEANFTTIQPFKQGSIESSNRVTTNSLQFNKLQIRVDSKYEIQYEVNQIIKQFSQYFTSSKSIPKKKQSEIKEINVQYPNKKKSLQFYYLFLIYSKVGFHSKSWLAQVNDSQELNISKIQSKIPSQILNFIANNQIIISLSCSQMFKNNAIYNQELKKLEFGWFSGIHKQQFLLKKQSRYLMIPQGISGFYFKQSSLQKQVSQVKYELANANAKQSMNFMGYAISMHSSKAGNVSETLYILDNICTIQNKTSHVLQIQYCRNFDENTIKTNQNKKITILPFQKESVSIESLEQAKGNKSYISITAYCRSKNKHSQYHLSCNTHLELTHSWENNLVKQSQTDKKSSGQQILYWYLNPAITYNEQINTQYQTDIIKITSKKSYINKNMKLQFILQGSINQKQQVKQFKPKQGYLFKNNLPKNYAVLIREENGRIPQQHETTKKIRYYYEQINEEKDMEIPYSPQDQLQSPLKPKNKKQLKFNEVIQIQENESYKFHQKQVFKGHNLNSSRSKIVQYLIQPWLTNLKIGEKTQRTFIVEIYKTDCNLEFQNHFQINISAPFQQTSQIIIQQDHFKNKLMQFEGSEQPYSESNNSVRQGKKALNVISKKMQQKKQSIKKKLQHKVQLYSHKIKDSSYQFYIESKDLHLNSQYPLAEQNDYKRTTQLKIFQISLTIQITNNPKDTLTLELQNLKLNLIQLPPSSHARKIDLKVDKLLIREDRNLSILKMLHSNRQFLAITADMQKVMEGSKFNDLLIKLEPLQLDIRQGILFKILSRVVEIRNHYFVYGNKLDQILKSNHQWNGSHKNIFGSYKKSESKIYLNYQKQVQKQIKKQLKKSNPKLLLLKNLVLNNTNIYFSFSKDEYAQNKQQFIQDPIIKYFILIPAVRELKIAIPQIQVKQFNGVSGDLGKLILKKIKHNIGGTILRSLSSLAVLDSPVAAIDGVFQYLQAILIINSS